MEKCFLEEHSKKERLPMRDKDAVLEDIVREPDVSQYHVNRSKIKSKIK